MRKARSSANNAGSSSYISDTCGCVCSSRIFSHNRCHHNSDCVDDSVHLSVQTDDDAGNDDNRICIALYVKLERWPSSILVFVVYSNVLVLRIGGQTTDVTVMAVNSGMYRVCGSVSVSDLGGCIIDDLLVEHFAAEFQRFAPVF